MVTLTLVLAAAAWLYVFHVCDARGYTTRARDYEPLNIPAWGYAAGVALTVIVYEALGVGSVPAALGAYVTLVLVVLGVADLYTGRLPIPAVWGAGILTWGLAGVAVVEGGASIEGAAYLVTCLALAGVLLAETLISGRGASDWRLLASIAPAGYAVNTGAPTPIIFLAALLIGSLISLVGARARRERRGPLAPIVAAAWLATLALAA